MKKNKLKILYSKNQIGRIVSKLAKRINRDYSEVLKGKPLVIISVLKGAFIFTADLIREIDLEVQLEFIKISSYGTRKTSSGKIDAPLLVLPNLNNRHVLIVEDIVDSGRTIKFLREYLTSQFKLGSLKIICLLNKKARREVDVKADYVGFEVENHFLVGYGLDTAERYRHLPYLSYVK